VHSHFEILSRFKFVIKILAHILQLKYKVNIFDNGILLSIWLIFSSASMREKNRVEAWQRYADCILASA